MSTKGVLTERQVVDVADSALREVLPQADLDHVEVRSGLDHDGDEALFVTAVVGAHVGEMAGDTLTKAHVALADRLRHNGVLRFPYLKLLRLGESLADDDLVAASQ